MANDRSKVLISRRRRPPSSPDWASLPSGILDLILDHLIQVVDYLRFSSVCKHWLSAALYQKDRRRRESIIHNQSIPMLLTPPLPPKKAAGDHHLWRLYSVTSGKLLNFDQLKMVARQPPYESLCGSSYGWLGAENGDSSITFFNPFSDFAYIKPGSSDWTYISSTRPRRFTDAVYHLGKFYLVDDYCCVTSVDVSTGGTGRDTTTSEAKPPHVEVVVPPIDSYNRRVYLVVSSGSGDLLLVHTLRHPTRLQTIGFKIFNLLGLVDSSDHQNFAELVEINNLGNDALFLGHNHSLCVSASNSRGCRPNCIYYVNGCQDTNVYSLEDRSFKPLKRIKTRLRRTGHPPPIWIVPTLL